MTDAEIAAAGPGPGEASRRPRLFGFLFHRVPGERPGETPAPGVDAAADTPPAPSMTDAEIAAAGPGPGQASRRPRFFGFLFHKVPGDVASEAPAEAPMDAPADNPGAIPADQADAGDPVAPSITDAEVAAADPAPAAAPQRPRLFGFLTRRAPVEVTAAAPDAAAAEMPGPDVAPDSAAPPPRRGWLFRLRNRNPRSDVSAPPSGPAGDLPFGELISVCGLPEDQLGTEVARSHGGGAYRLFDTAPASTEPRAQFVTGFKDGCPRQFTASLALFGSAAVHEATRYNPLNTNPYSATDKAYERIKNRVCGVRKGDFCPERRMEKLSRAAVFLSVYQGFGDPGTWLEIFLHNDRVVTSEQHAG